MKQIFILFVVMGMMSPLHATVDVQGEVTIVVNDLYGEEGFQSYYLKSVPTQYCVGIDTITLAKAITQPVKIKSNYGCGHSDSMVQEIQVNAATCANLVATEYEDENGFNYNRVNIRMDLSGCGDLAENSAFTRALRRAITSSYGRSGYEVLIN